MNGFCGTAGADTALGTAGAPTNAGAAARSDGFWGIGIAGTPSARAAGQASATASRTNPSAADSLRLRPMPLGFLPRFVAAQAQAPREIPQARALRGVADRLAAS